DKLFLCHLALERRHYRLIAFDDLGTGVEDRIPYVIVIGDDGLSADQANLFAEDTFELSTSLLRAARVARGTAELILEKIASLCDRRLSRFAALQPCFKLRLFHHINVAAHARVVKPAIFRTEQMIFARLRRLEPHICEPPGDDVRLG